MEEYYSNILSEFLTICTNKELGEEKMITYKPLREKDFNQVIKIASIGLNLKRYCSNDEEFNLFSKAYVYEYLANATYALGKKFLTPNMKIYQRNAIKNYL